MQPRAKPGGEVGANGEWYEGGKFIATTDHAKSNRKSKKGTGRQEIEPYKWEVPAEPGLRSIWQAMSPGVFTGRLPDGRMGLNPHVSDHTWLYYNDNDPQLVEKAKARFQALADRFNAGERWFSEDAMQRNDQVTTKAVAATYGAEIPDSELSRVGRFEVALGSVGNPDYGQNPDADFPGVPRSKCSVSSLEEAAAKCREYIEDNDLGGGNWSGGDVYEDGKLVARISYNGRVWRAGEAPAVVSSMGSRTATESVSDHIPVLFQIDPLTKEATGTVMPFCSDDCRAACCDHGLGETLPGTSEVSDFGYEVHCEQCGEIAAPAERKERSVKETSLRKAVEAFWGAVCDHFPEMVTGDSQLSGEDMAALAIWRDGNSGDRPVQNGAFDVEWAGDERIEEALQHGIEAAGAVLFEGEAPQPPKPVIEQLNGCVRHVLFFNEPETNARCRP